MRSTGAYSAAIIPPCAGGQANNDRASEEIKPSRWPPAHRFFSDEKSVPIMGQLTPEQLRAKRIMDKRNASMDERDRQLKQRKAEMRGKKIVNGRVYTEKAVCKSKHDALKVEKEVRAEEANIPTHVSLSAKGWTVYVLAQAG
jgi:hypothetical protein